VLALVAALAVMTSGAPRAHAGSPQSAACARAAEDGQALRDDGKLFRAREAFGRCIRAECPKVIATECASWLDEVTARQPSIVVAVRDANGNDVPDAKVRIDGATRDDAAAGRAVVLDPGAHVVTSVVGGSAIEQRIVVREREKDRRVVLEPPPKVVVVPPPRPPAPRLVEERPVPVVTYVLSGVSVVLGAFGAGFGISAANDYAKLEETCPRGCSETDILGLRAKTVTADIALSLALVAAVGAVVVYVVRPTVLRPVGGTATREGAWVDWSRGAVHF